MRKCLVLLLFIMLVMGNVQAIPVPFTKRNQPQAILKRDTSGLKVKHFNKQALDNYLEDSDFDYADKTQKPPGWWTRFWRWVWGIWMAFLDWVGWLFSKLFGGAKAGKNAAPVIKYVLIIGGAVGLCYLVARMLGMDLIRLFRKKKALVDVPYTEYAENIHEIDFDSDIEAALSVKNYRLAVRLLYLRCLKQLSDAGAINWRIEKTNSAYLRELRDGEQRNQFAAITRQFEYVWYGNFPVDGASFQRINLLFQDFKKHAA